MIADSKEVKEWELQINLEPDQIEAKILKRPGILMLPPPVQAPQVIPQIPGQPMPQISMQPQMQQPTAQVLDDTNILRQIVSQPVNFQRWAIFCLEKDIENGKYLQDKFYSLSEQFGLNIFVDYGDIVSLHNRSSIEDFKDAINSYFKDYVEADLQGKGGRTGAKKKPPVLAKPTDPSQPIV